MSLPKTIPFCPVHGEPWNDHEGACNQWLAAPDDSDCVVEWLPVAGRDDLLIRREDGNIDRIGSDLPNWSPRQPERIQDFARARRQRPGRFAPWERDIGFLIAFYEAALAAAEGTE